MQVTAAAMALAGIAIALTVAKGLQDPDFFWHIATGRLIVQSGSVPNVDPFSFTWAGQAWTPHEWLSEVLMYAVFSAWGGAGAVLLFALMPAAMVLTQAVTTMALTQRVVPAIAPVALGMLATVPYVTLRPQAESWWLLALLVAVLISLSAQRPARALLLIPLFLVWANLHGLYIVGLGVVMMYALFTTAGKTPMAPRRRWMLAAAGASVFASMLTPAGPAGILYPLRYLQPDSWGLQHIPEWQSPSFHEPAQWAFLALIVLVGLNGGRRTPAWLVAASWLGIAMGLVAERNVPVAAVLCIPTLALGFADRSTARRSTYPRSALGRHLVEITAGIAIAAGAIWAIVPGQLGTAIDTQIAAAYPTRGVDILRRVAPAAHIFSEYGWGGYIAFRLYAVGGREFVDGRSDMFGQMILEDYSRVRAADPSWTTILEKYGGVQAILLQPQAPLARGPALAVGWCEAYRDQVEVLLLRTCSR